MNKNRKTTPVVILFSLLVALAAVNCRGQRPKMAYSTFDADKAPQSSAEARSGEGGSSAPASRELPPTERKQIVSVNMFMEVDEVAKRVKEAEAIAAKFGGYVFQSNVSQKRGFENAQLTIMVPAGNLEQAAAEVEKLGFVENQSQNSEDVTRQFIDLNARLNNYKKEEDALGELLGKPGKIEEILKVENELSRVRSEIERIQGELNFLEKQTSYSRIFLNLHAKAAPAGFKNWPISHTVKRAATAFLYAGRALISLVIYAAFFLPFIILIYLAFRILGWWLRRKPGAR
jgi:hypothetical protein